jgi:hypothetical protein
MAGIDECTNKLFDSDFSFRTINIDGVFQKYLIPKHSRHPRKFHEYIEL